MPGSMLDILRKRDGRFRKSRMVFLVRFSDVSGSLGEYVRAILEKELQEKMLRELKKEIELKAKAIISFKNYAQNISRASLGGKIKRIYEFEKLVIYPAALIMSRQRCGYRDPISMCASLNKKTDNSCLLLVDFAEHSNCVQLKLIVNHVFDVLNITMEYLNSFSMLCQTLKCSKRPFALEIRT